MDHSISYGKIFTAGQKNVQCRKWSNGSYFVYVEECKHISCIDINALETSFRDGIS